jgi:hypothetical protein
MVIVVRDHVSRCYTWQDGAALANVIRPLLARGERLVVSFAGFTDVPSSFVNAAFVSLLDTFSLDFVRDHMSVVDSTRQINNMIRKRLYAEAGAKVAA